MKEGTPGQIPDDGYRWADVQIKTKGTSSAVVTINGEQIPGLIGYEIIHDRTRTQTPIIKLHIQCKELTIDSPMIPEVPEPWSLLYDFKWKRYGSFETGNPPGGPKLPDNPGDSQDNHNHNR